MKRQKQPSKSYDYPLPFENDGVKVEVVSKWRVPKRMKARDTYTSQSWSYRLVDLDDGIGQYAYWGYDKMLKRDYFYVLKIEDQELLEALTYFDKLEELPSVRGQKCCCSGLHFLKFPKAPTA